MGVVRYAIIQSRDMGLVLAGVHNPKLFFFSTQPGFIQY